MSGTVRLRPCTPSPAGRLVPSAISPAREWDSLLFWSFSLTPARNFKTSSRNAFNSFRSDLFKSEGGGGGATTGAGTGAADSSCFFDFCSSAIRPAWFSANAVRLAMISFWATMSSASVLPARIFSADLWLGPRCSVSVSQTTSRIRCCVFSRDRQTAWRTRPSVCVIAHSRPSTMPSAYSFWLE